MEIQDFYANFVKITTSNLYEKYNAIKIIKNNK